MSALGQKRTCSALGGGSLPYLILSASDVNQRRIDTTTPNGRLLFGILARLHQVLGWCPGA